MMRFNPPGSPPIHFNELHHVLYSTGTFWLLIFLADHERTNELGDFQFVKKSVQSVELIKGLIARLVCLSVCLFVCRAIYPNWTSVSINSPCLVSFKSKSPFLCVCSQCLTIPAANAAPESKICTLCIVQLSDSMKAEHIVSDSSVSRRKCNNQLQSRLALVSKLAIESWQVDAENGSGQMMPKGLGTWEVLTSFPLGLFGDPYPTNKQIKLQSRKKTQELKDIFFPVSSHCDQSVIRLYYKIFPRSSCHAVNIF